MTINKTNGLVYILFIMIMPGYLLSQVTDNRKSEEDIKIEDQFIAAKLLQNSGKKNEAIKLLDSLRRVTTPNASIHFELAKLYHSNKDINQTESNIKAAVQFEPNNIWIRKWEVNFSMQLGRNDDALKTLNHLISLVPKENDNYDLAAKIMAERKEFAKALQVLELKDKNIGWTVENTIKKAELLDSSGKINECIQVLRTLTTMYPNEKKYYRLIINTLHSNDKVSETEPYLKKILEIDPYDNDAKLGLLLLNKGKGTREDYFVSLIPLISNSEAPIDMKIKELLPHVQKHASSGDTMLGTQLIAVCDKLVIAHPNEAKSHAIYADVLKNNGNYVAAARQYEKTLRLNNKNYAVWEQLMFCQLFISDYDGLWITSSDAIDFFPNQAMSYYFSALALTNKNELKKAGEMLAEASMIAAGNPNIEARIGAATGHILLLNKESEKAKSYAEKSIQLSDGKSTEATELMGDIYKANDDHRNAALYYQKSYDLGNRSLSLLNKMSAIKNN